MVSRRVRKVRTASGAVGVQIITAQGSTVLGIEHVGSAHTDAELEVLLELAWKRLHPGQDAFDFPSVEKLPARMADIADWTRPGELTTEPKRLGRPLSVAAGGRLVSTASLVLWQVLRDAYARLGFDAVGDEAFEQMVLARIIEPVSKADTIRVLEEIGVTPVSLRTLFRSLSRCQTRDYRDVVCRAAAAHSSQQGGLAALVLYDVTTLHFQVDDEDDLRKVGMSKEHRVDPQVQVGLLVDPAGFPLEVHLFEATLAETTSLIPVLTQFQARHGVTGMVVVADAGMLSASNLNRLEDAGFWFIVGSRITKAPYDLAEHFHAHGDHFVDGQTLESGRTMGSGSQARSRRVVYQYSFTRRQRDDKAINAQIARAAKIAAGKAPVNRARFLKVTGADKQLDQATIDRARQLAGLKGYVTNLPIQDMPADQLIGHYHDLWHVEQSFRMAKSDLRARPIFHHTRDSIEAHITIVFTALAVARYLTATTGMSVKKIVRELRAVQTATIQINRQQLSFNTEPGPTATQILNALTRH